MPEEFQNLKKKKMYRYIIIRVSKDMKKIEIEAKGAPGNHDTPHHIILCLHPSIIYNIFVDSYIKKSVRGFQILLRFAIPRVSRQVERSGGRERESLRSLRFSLRQGRTSQEPTSVY